MVGMVRAMKVAMAPTTKMAILMTHMISPSEAWQQIQSISLHIHKLKIFFTEGSRKKLAWASNNQGSVDDISATIAYFAHSVEPPVLC